MFTLTIQKRLKVIFITLFISYLTAAQEHNFRFFPMAGLSLESHALIGKIGSRFYLLNTNTKDVLELSILDTSTLKRTIKEYEFPKRFLSIRVNEHSLVFVSYSQENNGGIGHMIELDEEGELINQKQILLPTLHGPVKAITSADKQFILFYEMAKMSSDSTQLRGVLIGTEWKIRKQLLYSYHYNNEKDAEPEIFLDDRGNTHVLVYDKYSNYRISSDITVNSIPVGEEQIISETFTFEKVKMKGMQVFQNMECNCIQVEGIYVDGNTKENKGLYSIVFPPGRKNELAPRFIPFTDELIRNFRKGFSATDESILKSIQLQEMLYSENGSFAILRISNGIPQPVQKQTFEEDPSTRSFNKALSVSRGADYQPPPLVIATAAATANGQNQRQQTVRVPNDKYANAPPQMNTGPKNNSPLSSRSSGRNAPKFVCVKLTKDQGINWISSRTLDIFNLDDNIYNKVYFLSGEKESLPMVLYQADGKDEPAPTLITLKQGKPTQEWFPEKRILFSPLLFLDNAQYASLYYHIENGISGLMVVSK